MEYSFIQIFFLILAFLFFISICVTFISESIFSTLKLIRYLKKLRKG